MSVLKRLVTLVWVVGSLTIFVWPADAFEEQGRAVRRPRPTQGRPFRPARVYGPRYRSYNPYLYGSVYYGPYWGPHYYGAWGPSPYYGGYYYRERGSVRLQVKPEQTEVYVDGYYAGVVDSYDGFFQRLHLPPGEHDLELRLDGYRSIQEQVYLTVGSTYRITHEMERLAAGETTPPPPTPTPRQDDQRSQLLPSRPLPPATDREPSRPRTSPNRFGRLAIRVQPFDALIFVDGEEWQSPDGSRLELEIGIGRHRIEVRSEDYESYVTDVEVRPGDTTTVNISLPRDQEER